MGFQKPRADEIERSNVMAKKNATQRTSRPVRYHIGKFPPQKIDWSRLVPLIGPAAAALARYDGLLSAIPNANILLSPLTTQEAVLSSRIEGTYATMGEVLEYEAGKETADPAKAEDIVEVLNYRRAIREAVQALDKLPLCGRVIKQAHATLLSGVRGHDKARGKYRTIQNYIGNPNRPIEEARFEPIAPERLADAMSQWEKYLHSKEPDALVQLAIVHAEFESLHPFLDGNGRMGRMLVPLFLFERGLLHTPNFYVSDYLERNRQEYFDGLLAVSRDDDWTGWCAVLSGRLDGASREERRESPADFRVVFGQERVDGGCDAFATRDRGIGFPVRPADFQVIRFDCPLSNARALGEAHPAAALRRRDAEASGGIQRTKGRDLCISRTVEHCGRQGGFLTITVDRQNALSITKRYF